MAYLLDTAAKIAEQRAALSKAEGLPRRSVVIGGPDYLPATFSPGAPGWTEHACSAPIEVGDGTALLDVPNELRVHLGTTVVVDGRDVAVAPPSSVKEEAALPKAARDKLAAIRAARESAAAQIDDRAGR